MAKRTKPASPPPDASMPVVVLHGPELFIRAELVAALRDELREAKGDLDVVRFDGERDTVADALDECRSFGLMSAHKLIVVDNADPFVRADARGPIERYVEHPADGATLALLCKQWYASKLDKQIEAVDGTVFKCEPPSERQALSWAKRRASSKHGAALDADAAELLIQRLGADLGRIDAELAKLAVSAGGGSISRNAVIELVGMTREEEVWSIQAPLLSGNPEHAAAHLMSVLDSASRDASIPTMYACVDLARKLHLAASAMHAGTPPQAVAKNIGLWGPARDAVLGAASRLSPAGASRLFAVAVDADAASKSGGGNPRRLVERLALRIALAIHDPATA